MIFVKLAWKNMFRNKRRTLIAGLALGAGLAAIIFYDALALGTLNNMIRIATSSFIGQAQVMQKDFRQTEDASLTVVDGPRILEEVRREPVIELCTPRTISLCMITSPANLSNVKLVGVDPATERHLTKVDESTTKGAFFDGADERDLVIGTELAEDLEAGLGDRIVVTVSQARGGQLSQEMFRVSGIFDMHDPVMNGTMAFIRLPKAQKMLGIGSDFHQIAIRFKDISLSRDNSLPFWSKYSQNGNVALPWTEIIPEIKTLISLSRNTALYMGLLLVGVVACVIMNTLFMSIFERLYEFGVLRAVGTKPKDIARLVIYEAASLAVISMAIGCLLGFAVSLVLSLIGINYGGSQFYGVTLSERIRPVITLRQYLLFPPWILLFTVLIGIYPAIYASKITPAVAMKRSY